MLKTKMGISVGLLGAALYFSGLFSGYFVTIILAGYVLLAEDNIWLRKAAVKSVAVLMLFSFLEVLIGLIPDFISFINMIFNLFNGYLSLEIVTDILSIVTEALHIIEIIVFIVLGLKAFSQGTIYIPVVDDIINKYVD